VTPHEPVLQLAAPCVGAGHTVVQVPQWLMSLCVSTQAVPHVVCVQTSMVTSVPASEAISNVSP
jgi:hypothetical protein